MYPSNGLSGRNTTGYPAGSDDLTQPINLGNVRALSSRNMYSNIVPSRPAPEPPTSSSSGLGRRGSTAGSTYGGSSRDPLGRRSSLVSPQPLAYSGLSATRPSMFESEFGSNSLPPLLPLPSGRRSGARSTESSNPRLGSGQLGSGMGLSGGLNDGNNSPSMYSRSQPIDIGPTHIGLNDWRSRISPGPPLENPTLRETRREARHRTRQDWEIDGELHPNVSLDSDLDDSTDGETESPVGSQPRQRTRSLRRTPELENLRGGDDSGFSLDNRLASLDLNSGSGLSGGSGRTYLPSGRSNGQRARRGAFSSTGSGIGTGTTPMNTLPELDLSGGRHRFRHMQFPPLGPPPSGPLPPLPHLSGPSGLAGIPRLSSRRASAEDSEIPSMYTDPFAPRPHIPGQHRIREHMLEFPDGAYTVRIRNNQQARQEQQRRERERSSSSGGGSGFP